MATKKSKVYSEQRARGLTRAASAIVAGLSTDDGSLSKLEARPSVQEEIARLRAETAENLDIKKEYVVDLLQTAACMAKISGDVTGLVAAAREIGKMLGFYAPEIKKIVKGLDAKELQKVLTQMSDEELYALKHGRTFEGDFKRLPAPTETVSELPKD